MSDRRRLLLAALTLLSTTALAQAPGGEPAATVIRLNGEATAVDSDGAPRALAVDALLFAGDTVRTGGGRLTYAALEYRDQTRFTIGPNGELEITDFVYGRSAEEDRIATRVVKGVFRFVSGLIARRRPAAMGVDVSVATIGIRGTTVGGEVEGERATVVLLEDEEPTERASTIVVANQHGSVTIEDQGFGTTVPDANSPPEPPRRMRLRTIENLMRSLQAIPRAAAPRPRPRVR